MIGGSIVSRQQCFVAEVEILTTKYLSKKKTHLNAFNTVQLNVLSPRLGDTQIISVSDWAFDCEGICRVEPRPKLLICESGKLVRELFLERTATAHLISMISE